MLLLLSTSFIIVPDLQVLRIDHNELTSLPDEIGSLSNLEQLSVSSNILKALPDTICNLSKLQLLDIRKNSLRSLPMTIYQNRCLQSLRLDEDCEWIRPPRAVVIEGTQAILSYFAQGKKNRYRDIGQRSLSFFKYKCSALL